VTIKVSSFLQNFENVRFFTRTMAVAAMDMVSTGGFWGLSFHLEICPQGVAFLLFKNNPTFGSRRSKFDHLTVSDALPLYFQAGCTTSTGRCLLLPFAELFRHRLPYFLPVQLCREGRMVAS
jgi:hypothetical protein